MSNSLYWICSFFLSLSQTHLNSEYFKWSLVRVVVVYLLAVSSASFMLRKATALESSNVTSSGASSSLESSAKLNFSIVVSLSTTFNDDSSSPRCFFTTMLDGDVRKWSLRAGAARRHLVAERKNHTQKEIKQYSLFFCY